MFCVLGFWVLVLGDPLKGTLLSPAYGLIKRDLTERICIPNIPLNPNSYHETVDVLVLSQVAQPLGITRV